MNMNLAGNCPKCGSPIYMPATWEGVLNYTCNCRFMILSFPENTYMQPPPPVPCYPGTKITERLFGAVIC